MNLADLPDHVEHFRHRVIQDAFAEATAAYWTSRADTFAAAMPRPGDYTGQATPEQIEERRHRIATTEVACRIKAQVMIGGNL